MLLVEHLRKQGVLATIDEHARRRFGHYEVIDFLAVLFGYAISGERTLEAFYERLARNARALGTSQVTIKLFGIPQAFALWLGLAVGWGKRDQATFRSEEELAASRALST